MKLVMSLVLNSISFFWKTFIFAPFCFIFIFKKISFKICGCTQNLQVSEWKMHCAVWGTCPLSEWSCTVGSEYLSSVRVPVHCQSWAFWHTCTQAESERLVVWVCVDKTWLSSHDKKRKFLRNPCGTIACSSLWFRRGGIQSYFIMTAKCAVLWWPDWGH